ncbi:hypothetical protein FOA52_012368 [Chlamydomonas sp. UWO 241]|nr:hypothetical protein FOA52_012368 [Chlamydomonas sp. UWO 241]
MSQSPASNQAAPQGEAVLCSGLIFALLWSELDAGDKRQLRYVSRSVRAMVDGAVETLGGPDVAIVEVASELADALALWPGLHRLKLSMDIDDLEIATVLGAAPLPRLQTLELSALVQDFGEDWSVPALDPTAAAGLRELRWVASAASDFDVT